MNPTSAVKWYLLLSFVLFLTFSATGVKAVELTVRNYLDVPRIKEPVTVGLPFPAGWEKDPSHLRLLDQKSNPVPLQVRVDATWSDGSIMWALLDFPAHVDAASTRVYRLKRGKPDTFEDKNPLRVNRTEAGVAVITGPMKAVLANGKGPVISGLWLDWNEDGDFESKEQAAAASTPGVINGMDASTNKPFSEAWGRRDSIVIEEQGSQKVQILVTGSLAGAQGDDLLEYDIRLFFFAGSSRIRIQLTVRNPMVAGQADDRWLLGCEGSFYIDRLEMSLQFLSGQEPPQMILGSLFDGLGFEARQIPLERSLSIHQESSGGDNWFHRNHVDKDNLIPMQYRGYKVFYGNREICSGDRPTPWAAVEDSRKGMAVAVRGFWQNFPKALKVDRQGLVSIALWPHREGGPHELQGGEQKTHELAVYLQTGRGGGETFDHWSTVAMRSCLKPLVAWAPADWYMESGAFGLGVAYTQEGLEEYEWLAQAPVMDERYNVYKGREFIDEYGWRNYGDFLADNEPDETHGPNKGKLTLSHWNLAFDYAWGMLLQCVRTATGAPEISRRWWQLAGEGVRHLSDIDIYHTGLDEEGRYALGGRFYHTHHGVNAGRATHRASPEEELWNDLHWPWGRGVNNIDAFFYDSRGMCYYSLMSGDLQVRRSALQAADLVEYSIRNNRNPQIENFHRQAGNNLQVLTDAWIITHDDRYRRAADEIVEKSRASIFGFGPDDDPREAEIDGLGFHSIFFDALGRYVEVSDKVFGLRQKMAIASLVNYTRFVLRYMWDEESKIFCHGLKKELKGEGNTGVWTYRVCDALLYALPYLESKQEKELLLKRTVTAFRSANRINLAGHKGYRFITSKNSNFIINAGPRCAFYMLNRQISEN